ncbi:MAG: type II secretion system protein [Gammaproteobacteria bacterium]|jgi:general secretion pathway protein I|nr:type II secretion system protein [Gammaproteobacteria bacterium]
MSNLRLSSLQLARSSRSGGFTLIEILAAFLVFALSFAVIMQIMSTSMRNTRVAGDLTQAALYAQSKMEMLGIDAPVEEGSENGEFDDKYHWEMQTELYNIEDERGLDPELIPVDLYKVALQVYWRKGNHEESADFTTLYAQDRNYQTRAFGR